MKIRSDFVTNSSSSSFIIGFPNKTDSHEVKLEDILALQVFETAPELITFQENNWDDKSPTLQISKHAFASMFWRHIRRSGKMPEPGSENDQYAYNRYHDRHLITKKEVLETLLSAYPWQNVINSSSYTEYDEWFPKNVYRYDDEQVAKWIEKEYGIILEMQSEGSRTNRTMRFTMESSSRLYDIWMDQPEQTEIYNGVLRPTRRQLISMFVEAWWAKNVEPNGIAVLLEFGDSHGLEGYLEKMPEHMDMFYNKDIIIVSNH